MLKNDLIEFKNADNLIKARNEIDTEIIKLSKKIRKLQELKKEYECELWNKCDHIWVKQDQGMVGWTPKICSKCDLSALQPRKQSNYLR
jgi:hypothetical protein